MPADWAGCHLPSVPFCSSPSCSLPRQADHCEMHHSGSLVLMQPAARRLLREAVAPRRPLATPLTPAACGCPVPLILGSPGSCPPLVTLFLKHPQICGDKHQKVLSPLCIITPSWSLNPAHTSANNLKFFSVKPFANGLLLES